MSETDRCEKLLPNVIKVTQYLKDDGWKVSQATVYNHVRDGKLRKESDGAFSQIKVDRYASKHLTRLNGEVGGKVEHLQEQKLKADIERIEEQTKRIRLQREIEERKYIPKDQFEIEIAARAGVLEAGIKHLFQTRISEWVYMVSGRVEKAQDLLSIIFKHLDTYLNEYANTREFNIEFKTEEHESAFDHIN